MPPLHFDGDHLRSGPPGHIRFTMMLASAVCASPSSTTSCSGVSVSISPCSMLSSWLNFVGGYPKTAPSRFPHKLPEQSSAFSRELFPDFLLLVSTTCRRVPDEMCTNI